MGYAMEDGAGHPALGVGVAPGGALRRSELGEALRNSGPDKASLSSKKVAQRGSDAIPSLGTLKKGNE
jgi:hypothetical protein